MTIIAQITARLTSAVTIIGFLFWSAAWLPAEDWAQFRGPNATGIAAESTNPPIRFSLEENLQWSAESWPRSCLSDRC